MGAKEIHAALRLLFFGYDERAFDVFSVVGSDGITKVWRTGS